MNDERTHTDGGTPTPAERDVRRAGDRPPDVPTQSTLDDLLPRLLEDAEDVSAGYHVRAALRREDPGRAGEQLVRALERKVTVVGSTLDAGIDPKNPQLDVLIDTEHTMSQVASALGRVAPVDGAVVVDVTADAERALEAEAKASEADAASANDVFNELQEQVSQLEYDDVVEELEGVSFPGGPDPDEEVDLEAEAGVELTGADVPETDTTAGDVELAADAAETIDLDGPDEKLDPDAVDAKALFGESDGDDDRDSPTTRGGAADENAIEEAIRSVETSMDDPGADGDDSDAPASDRSDASDADEAAGEDDAVATDEAPAADEATGMDETPVADEAPVADGAAAANAPGAAPGGAPAETAESADVDVAADVDGAVGASVEPAEADAAEAPTESSAAPPDQPTADATTDDVDVADPMPLATESEASDEVAELVDELIAALESGDVGPERRQKLRGALGIESTHGLDVRMEYLQKRVDNLAAYTDAWEAFLADHGTGNAFVADVESDIDDLQSRLSALESGGKVVDGTVADGTAVADLESRLSALEATHESDVSELRTRLDEFEADVKRRVDAVTERVQSITQSLERFASWRDSVNDVLRNR